jgi:hypothetical protein
MAEAASKKRKAKELPDELLQLTESTFRKVMKFRLETDPHETGEVKVAYEVSLCQDNNATIELDKLTLDQLRKLCKNVGVQYVNNCTKFACRKALWILSNHQEQREKDGIRLSTVSERASSNMVRLVNVVFSHNFFESFLKLNDIKTRSDHETGGLPSDFWADVAEALNGDAEDDDSATNIVISLEDPHYDELMDLDLDDFDITTSSVLRKKFNLLLKVRKVMKQNMTLSGEHDNDPYNFVDVAMKKVGGTGLTKTGCYYFFQRCATREHEEAIDDIFGDTMDEILMGNTNSPLDSSVSNSDSGGGGSDKKRAYAAIVDMSNVVTSIAAEMKKSTSAMEEKNRIDKQSQLIMLAQHLGKDDLLQGLLADLSGGA